MLTILELLDVYLPSRLVTSHDQVTQVYEDKDF